ncbi:MAG TPA: tetratricopeptide repeat protein [Gemmatimonadaceae bacterium]|nr:tetratricopeptide repeat protein [Gemmatimonadaceae bacterium]
MPDGQPPLRDRHDAIVARMDDPSAAGEREAIKAEIIALYKDTEREIAALRALREDIKKLVDRWKALTPAGGLERVAVPTPSAPPPSTPVMADRLGASTYVEKGWSLISLGDHQGAERSLLRALELSPNDPETESLLGWAQMLQEKYDEAMLTFQKVLTRQPANSLARINLGYICLKKRIFGEAIEHLSRAIRLDNDRKATLYAHFYLGLVYSEREMYDDAEAFYRKALALGPNLVEAYYELGRALWFGGRKGAALQAWRDGEAANKFNPWGKRCAEMLKLVEAGGAPSRSTQ